MRELLDKWGPFALSLIIVAAAGGWLIKTAPEYVVLQAQAAEERSDNARVLHDITLTRLNNVELERIRVDSRQIDPAIKQEYLNKIDGEIKRLEKRAECLEEVMETGDHRKC